MRERFLDILCCPACEGDLVLGQVDEREGDAIVEGALECKACQASYPVRKRVAVFVEDSGYAESFGWQWTRFNRLQRDSHNGTQLVRNTILKRSGWSPGDLAGKTLLECGCGSGNDSEVLSGLAGTVVSVDLSRAVHSFAQHVLERENQLVLQADLRRAPLKREHFDLVYCHRVIQHTPDPRAAFETMTEHVKPGGLFFLHSYDTHWKSTLNYRYVLRPITKRLPHAITYWTLRILGPLLFVLVSLLNRIAFLRRLWKLIIPFENHSRILAKAGSTLTLKERYDYSFLVTFDALTPQYDTPNSAETLSRWFEEAGFEVEVRSRNPVIAIGRRPAGATLEPFSKVSAVHAPQGQPAN